MLGGCHMWRSTFREVSHSLEKTIACGTAMKPQNSMRFTFHTVDWRNSAPNQQAWFSSIVTSGFFSQLVWHRFGAMSFVAAWVSLATFGRARTKAWHEQRQEEPAIPCWWNQAKMWQQMKSYFGHLHIQLLEVFTRIEIYLVIYFVCIYLYILLICIPSYNHFLSTLQHHSKFPITDSWNTWQPWHPPESKRSESLNTWQGVISSHQPWRSLENHPNRESLVNWDWNPL